MVEALIQEKGRDTIPKPKTFWPFKCMALSQKSKVQYHSTLHAHYEAIRDLTFSRQIPIPASLHSSSEIDKVVVPSLL